MIIDLLGRVAECVYTPRRSIRRLLELGPHRPDIILQMVLLAYVLQVLLFGLLTDLRPDDRSILEFHFQGVINHVISFIVLGALVFGIGRMFGGQATVADAFAGVAWIELVFTFLLPMGVVGLLPAEGGEPSGFGALLLLGTVGIGIWMMTGAVAEIHRFKSTWSVFFGLMIVLTIGSLLFMTLVPRA
ncbi:MAG: YIP1 family protein [Pikeienuella sp.]